MVPALRIDLPGPIDAAAAFRVLAERYEHLVWADRPSGGASFIGVALAEPVIAATPEPGAFAALLDRLHADLPGPVASPHLGWWGWFGYELGAAAQHVPVAAADAPAAAFLLAEIGVELDGTGAAVVGLPAQRTAVEALAAVLTPLVGVPVPVAALPSAPAWRWRHERSEYLALIDRCLAAITAGDAYQLCLTNRITATLPAPLDPVDVLLRLRDDAPLAGAGIVRVGGWTLVSASPETLLTVDAQGRAVSRPIKGTRPRDPDPERDRALAEALRTDQKERAENLMIVDLVRNDLARVARVGSVAVPELLVVESYQAIHQLVSTITAEVPGDGFAAIRSLFPAGSMTGAPKHAALRILAGLEAGPRGVYAGAWGRIAADGTLALAVVIRSVLLHGTTATIGTGGGITILSDADAEWRELEVKAARMLRSIGVRDPFPSAVPHPGRGRGPDTGGPGP